MTCSRPPLGTRQSRHIHSLAYGAPRVLGSWGEGLFIFRELGSTANYFKGSWGANKHIHLGIKGALPKSKKNKYQASILSNSLKFCWLLGAIASGVYRPQTPIYQCDFFPISLPKLSTHSICIQHTIDNLERGLDYFCLTGTYCLRCFHFIYIIRSPNPHNCCKIFPFPLLKTIFFFYLFSIIYTWKKLGNTSNFTRINWGQNFSYIQKMF